MDKHRSIPSPSANINNQKKQSIEYESKDDLSLSLKLRTISLEWILSSTSHGLPSVFRVDQIYLKIIWLICFLGSTGGCAYIVINYIISYLEYDVNVSTTIETEAPVDFPAVTICNLNPYFKLRASSFITTTLATNNLTGLLNLTTLGSATAISFANKITSIFKAEAATKPNFTSTDRQNLGFFLDDMLVSCTFNGEDCSSNDFSFYQSYDYGNCYTFNSGSYANGSSSTIQTISSAGSGHSLELELFAGDPNNELFTYKRGFYVVIHNQSHTPIMDNEGVHISVGTQTNIGVDRTIYFKQPDPYSSCITDPTSSTSSSSKLYEAILTQLQEKSYRQKYCYKLCYQHQVIQSCSCYDPAYANPFPSFGSKTIGSCRTTIEATCMDETKTSFEDSPISGQCSDDCPQECEIIRYSTSINTANYPTDYYMNWLLLQTSLTGKFATPSGLSTQIKSSLAKLNVFYNDISYTALTESASVTWDTLLGNIGGQLGLFIGISFLSLIEVVEITCEVIRTIFLHRRGNRLTNRPPPPI